MFGTWLFVPGAAPSGWRLGSTTARLAVRGSWHWAPHEAPGTTKVSGVALRASEVSQPSRASGVNPSGLHRLASVALLALLAPSAPAAAQERYTLLVSGASGEPKYAENYERWRSVVVASLRSQPGFRDAHLVVLAETPGPGVGRASREGVRQAFADLRRQMTNDSVLFVVLFGHGSFDGVDAKFNLVGPDLEAREWAELVETLPGRVVLVNTTGSSFPFLERLSAPGRVIITATDSAAQRFDTVFPQFFVQALDEPSSDLDKNGQVSIWEAFSFASYQVRQWYEQRGQLSTERPILDDTGDGLGKEAGQPGPDGLLAGRLVLSAGIEEPELMSDPVLAPLVARRIALETLVEHLRLRKADISPESYLAELERLLIELARVSREIRARSSG